MHRDSAELDFFTSGPPRQLELMIEKLLGLRLPIAGLDWLDEVACD